MKPIVGVMPLWDDEKESLWMLPGYLEGIQQSGGIPIIFPFTNKKTELEQLIGLCDGFLFTGGHDVSPELYQEDRLNDLVSDCRKRDDMESFVLKQAIVQDKPILGICRGIQFINAALGGTLYQDIPLQHPTETEHHQHAPYDIPAHKVTIIKDSPLHELLLTETLAVNSYHHQAIKEIAGCLIAMAISEDGLVEAVYKPDQKFLWAVQWHPEFSYKTDSNSVKILTCFIDSMKRKSDGLSECRTQ